MKTLFAVLMALVAQLQLQAQSTAINPSLLTGIWPAAWIACPGAPAREYGVYHFRKTWSLSEKPDHFVVNVTADNRYRLLVNGTPVSSGPARGDLYNWYYETVDIAPYLRSGNNTIAALVWNMGTLAPVAQISNRTAFLLQGNTAKEAAVNTGRDWKVLHDSAYTPCSTDNSERLQAYIVVGPGDEVRGNVYPWGWEQPGYDDSQWANAITIPTGATPVGYGTDNYWTLAPRSIPLFEETRQRIPALRRSDLAQPPTGFPDGQHPLTVPANSTVHLLLDQTYNTVAYPELQVSGGKDAVVKLTYAEALFDKNGQKGNRNDINGKEIKGNTDIFHPDGGADRKFRPLWLRTYRYLQLEVTTAGEPLVITDIYGMRTGYPLQLKAAFSCNDSSLLQIWQTGWRTAKLCAGETYFDCPYYEQLQYEGDTRIQALISLYTSGDDRLVRKALMDFYHSRTPEGQPQGRYPSNRLQVIPTFSLFWITMIHDYWMHRPDDAFVKQFLSAMKDVLDWHERGIDPKTGMLGPLSWWSFIDWVPGLENFSGGAEHNSAIRTLHYAYTLAQAAELAAYFGQTENATHWRQLAKLLNTHTYSLCFDATRGVMADAPSRKSYSQHANIMAALSGALSSKELPQVLQKVLTDKTLSQATFYYRFYLTQALKKAHMADVYYDQLGPWRDMLQLGLTTFAEKPEPTRSDCHAWAASPNYDFLATICGIVPDAPGFKKVLIAPAMGALQEVKGVLPHPAGDITVSLTRNKAHGVTGSVVLPAGITGRFSWEGKEIVLHAGSQQIHL
ncbi:MAG: alpha-rhamnosidase [Chitinophaga sp.]|uniref:alpha-L-rhamnosidase-related protein n=1 Tax=Chitinophaga sp. TaxID=1869181 RepID=UPI001B10B18A|nr:alpha-L-rhamnosidase C-terminal domain-containing protein [Chitinophaga sp.]MBO9732682.1 alpha-rhamnosidase [Chitinophaga sp.]